MTRRLKRNKTRLRRKNSFLSIYSDSSQVHYFLLFDFKNKIQSLELVELEKKKKIFGVTMMIPVAALSWNKNEYFMGAQKILSTQTVGMNTFLITIQLLKTFENHFELEK